MWFCVPVLWWSLQFLVKVFTFLSLILCYSYFGTFLSTWSIYSLLIEKHFCECQNISIKILCVYLCLSSGDLFIFFITVLPFYSYFCVKVKGAIYLMNEHFAGRCLTGSDYQKVMNLCEQIYWLLLKIICCLIEDCLGVRIKWKLVRFTVVWNISLGLIIANLPWYNFDKKCINKEKRIRHLPGYCP